MYTPYPFERLPKLTRAQVVALSQLHSLFSDGSVDAALACAASLLGTTLACEFGPPEPCSGVRAPSPSAVWAELEPARAARAARAGSLHSLWLELPSALCEHLVDRVLGGDTLLAPAPSAAPLDELSLGALAYLLARIGAEPDVRLALRSIGLAAPGLADDGVAIAAAVQSGAARATIRAYVPASLLHDARVERAPSLRLAALPLSLWADAGMVRLELATLRSLECGDVIVLERAQIDAAGRGEVQLRVDGSGCRLPCIAHEGRLEVASIACTSEPAMSSGKRLASDPNPGERTLARDAPIELSLEVARFQLTLGELEHLQPGDVLLSGRRLGERVTLRAAGGALAEGDLVDVEGELGVRLTRLLAK